MGMEAEPRKRTTIGRWGAIRVLPLEVRAVPTNKVPFRERSIRRIIRAAQKEGLVAKSAAIAPDGTVTVSLAEPSQREVSVDIGDIPNEWDQAYGKDST